MRIPFKGVKISDQFVLLKTYAPGKILRGFIINLHKDVSESKTRAIYNGSIEIGSLNRREKIQSRIINGYVAAFHLNGTNHRSLVVPSEANVLPEVVVTCYIDGGGRGINYTDWISLLSLFGTGNSGYYSSLDGGGGGGGGGGSVSGITDNDGYVPYNERENLVNGGSGADVTNDNEILVDFEPVENLSPINIPKYLKCFSNLPDDGSICSIEILADIPVDKDPNKLMSWETGSPGHTFLQLKKIRGSQIVLQNIGFYPVDGWKTLLTNAPVPGKFVDNIIHEFNASLKMYLTPDQFKKTLDHVIELSKYKKYDIDEYNCTDFALDVFNTTRISNPLEIAKYDIPGGITSNGTSTPQAVYKKLKSMQQAGAESPNITIPGYKGFVAQSDGACN